MCVSIELFRHVQRYFLKLITVYWQYNHTHTHNKKKQKIVSDF